MDVSRVNIMSAGNTYNPCLLVLRSKGYQLSAEAMDDGGLLWIARKGDSSFAGHTPPEVLGLVTLGEEFGAEWQRQLPDVLGEVLAASSDEDE